MTSRAKSSSPRSRGEISLSDKAMMSNTALLALTKEYMQTKLIEAVEWCVLRDLNVELKINPEAIITNGKHQHDVFLVPYSCRHFMTGFYKVQPYHVSFRHFSCSQHSLLLAC